jgi:hypothetical protein
MPCDTQPRKGQTLQQRKAEVRSAIAKLNLQIAAGRIKPVVGPQGAIAFQGWSDEDRAGVSDACAFRMILVAGSVLTKTAIARAEVLAGRPVDRNALAQGWHSHDSVTWTRHD